MNLDQITPENINEILNQIKLSIVSELDNKGIYLESKGYNFEIVPEYDVNRSSEMYKFEINIKKEEVKGIWSNRSKYEIDIEVRRKNSSSYNNWSADEHIKISDKRHYATISKIYEIVNNEYIRRDILQKNKKMCDYIGLIKTTVKAEMKRDEVIQEILN
jgi:hypothetical protein